MPKVDQQLSNNPATLLLPKRPSASKPPADQSFEHALKRAQPRREVAPRQRAESPKPAPDGGPAQPEQQAVDAPADEQPVEVAAAPVESDAPVEDKPVQKAQKEQPAVAAVAVPILAQTPDSVSVSEIVDLPPAAPLEIADTGQPEKPSVAPIDQPAPLRAQDLPELEMPIEPIEPTERTDQPEAPEEAAQIASSYASPRIISDDAATDEEPPPVQKPSTTAIPKQVVATGTQPDVNIDIPDAPSDAIAPVHPIESDQEPVDDGAVKSETPKLRLVQNSADSDAADDGTPQQTSTTPDASAVKDSPPHTAAPPAIDAPEVKAPVEARPVLSAPPPPPPAPIRSDADFAATNHDRIVSSVRSQLLPNGGSMHLRLDPPELGALQIHVRMVDGVMQASFETTNDQATRMLSHSLSQLKNALETQGVSVDRLQVQQAPRDPQSGSSTEDQQRQTQQQDSQAQREQQRRELLNRMWRRIRLGRDPLDMVA